MNGACFKLFLILRAVYPKAEPYYDVNHIVTKINNRFYDIRGDVTLEINKNGKHTSLFKIYDKKSLKKVIKQLNRA